MTKLIKARLLLKVGAKPEVKRSTPETRNPVCRVPRHLAGKDYRKILMSFYVAIEAFEALSRN